MDTRECALVEGTKSGMLLSYMVILDASQKERFHRSSSMPLLK